MTPPAHITAASYDVWIANQFQQWKRVRTYADSPTATAAYNALVAAGATCALITATRAITSQHPT
jgi:hypothetical protein